MALCQSRRAYAAGLALCTCIALAGAPGAAAQTLRAKDLGLVYNLDDPASVRVATIYAIKRRLPSANVVGVHLARSARITVSELGRLRGEVFAQLPVAVSALLLVWSQPYAVGCMSITTAFAAGYDPAFCEPGCAYTRASPLYDSFAWQPYGALGWRPAMLLPADDEAFAHRLIDRGRLADGTQPRGSVYLIRTQDQARNVRAQGYRDAALQVGGRLALIQLESPVRGAVPSVLAYFTGAMRVEELEQLRFLPGGVADHLTSSGGVLDGHSQMSALAWLRQGATASYGTVSEPCNHLGKFPNPAVLLNHYLAGDTVLQAYWKSVVMPGQGLFIGEPLSAPFNAPAAD
jgi:uncharacterized protein (TIGR03790 family)